MNSVKGVLSSFATYRVDIYILTFSLALVYASRAVSGTLPYILAFVFTCAMVFVYLLNKTTDTAEDTINQSAGPLTKAEIPFVRLLAYVFLILPLPLFLYIPFGERFAVVYALVAFLGYWYSTKISFFGNVFRLKDRCGVKTTTSSIIWALPPLGIWVSLYPMVIWNPIFWYWTIIVFSNAAAMELIWDIRDVHGDRATGVRTVPAVFGVLFTQRLALGLIATACCFGILAHAAPPFFIGLLSSALFAWFASPGRGKLFFHATALTWSLVLLVPFFW